MPEAFVTGLEDNTRESMIQLLNERLADCIELTLAVKQAHWNIKGTSFVGIHELLDDVAERLRDHSDGMAERAVILGGLARGTLQDAQSASTIADYPSGAQHQSIHVDALKERFMDFGYKLRGAMEEAGEAGDEDTADLFTEVSRAIDKDAWFIGAHNAQPEDMPKS